MMYSDNYRVLIDGEPSRFSWSTMDGAVREARTAIEEHPDAEIRVRKPDIIMQRRDSAGGES